MTSNTQSGINRKQYSKRDVIGYSILMMLSVIIGLLVRYKYLETTRVSVGSLIDQEIKRAIREEDAEKEREERAKRFAKLKTQAKLHERESELTSSPIVDREARAMIATLVDIPGKNYKMSRFEVSQIQYETIVGANPSRFKDPERPVEQVSWEDCQLFLKMLNSVPVVKESGLTFRLPTQKEWVYACLAGANEQYCKLENGTEITADTLGQIAWIEENSGGQTHPVGQKMPNAFGLYDMYGNVREWCRDEYNGETWVMGRLCDSRDFERVNVGGGWSDWHDDSSSEYWCSRSKRHDALGFRLCAIFENPKQTTSDNQSGPLSSSGSSSDANMSGSSLSAILSETGFEFNESEGGERWYATFGVGDERVQMVLVNEKVETYEGISIREIWSIAAQGEMKPVSEEQMALLLQNSGGKYLGHWSLRKPSQIDDKWFLYYSVKMPTSATSAELKTAIIECAQVADHFEKNLFESDDN